MSTKGLEGLRIDRPEPSGGGGRTLGIVLAVLILAGLAAAAWWWFSGPSAAEVVTAPVRQVRAGAAATVLNATGYVTARRQATVSSKVTGKIVDVRIEEGMTVTEGQILARLDTSNVQTSLNLAKSQLAASRAAVAETKVQLAQAKLDLERAKNLLRDEVGTQADLDSANTSVDAAKARLDRQQEEIQVAERQLAIFNQQLADTVIRAPFDGVIVAKNAQPGEMISPNSAGGGFTRTGIGTVVDMSSLEIEVDVNEAYINRVTADQPVEAVLDAYPDWRIPASVIAIIPTADRQRATVRVRIGFAQLDPRILPDMGVKVAFREEGSSATPSESRVQFQVPTRAIRQDGDKEIVFIASDDTAQRRAISTSGTDGDATVVVSGLRGGERVIVDGPDTLVDGDPIREAK